MLKSNVKWGQMAKRGVNMESYSPQQQKTKQLLAGSVFMVGETHCCLTGMPCRGRLVLSIMLSSLRGIPVTITICRASLPVPITEPALSILSFLRNAGCGAAAPADGYKETHICQNRLVEDLLLTGSELPEESRVCSVLLFIDQTQHWIYYYYAVLKKTALLLNFSAIESTTTFQMQKCDYIRWSNALGNFLFFNTDANKCCLLAVATYTLSPQTSTF